jgi:uncharacterized protein (TIGR02246 family)
MRFRLMFLLPAVALLTISACQRPGEPVPAGTAADTTGAASMLLATTAAWNDGDLDAFIAPYDSASTFMTLQGPVGKSELKRRYASKYFAAGKPDQQLVYDSLRVRPLGSDYLLMTGRYLLSGSGKPEQAGWFSLVWRRTARGWRILHDHSS